MSDLPLPTDLPYDPRRSSLYTPEELLDRTDLGMTRDERIYRHFDAHGGRHPTSAGEALAQRLHDHAIDQALNELIGRSADERERSRIVGVMGGHRVRRGEPAYRSAARVAQLLAGHDPPYLVATGGGPGVMEAANLGAALGRDPASALEEAIDRLTEAPSWEDDPDGYLGTALEIAGARSARPASLAMPTWFYGHEPTNAFATHIAKYFSNGLREEGLLAVCLHGIVFAPGGAGTLEEVFTDHAQNSYAAYEYRSPMVFLGEDRWHSLYRLLRAEAKEEVKPWLALADTPEEIVAAIAARAPRRVAG